MAKLRVGVIFGGRSGEHEVSLNSAQSIMAALDPEKYEVVPIGIARDGAWVTGDPALALLAAPAAARELVAVGGGQPAASNHDLLPTAHRPLPTGEAAGLGGLDVVFPVLHGTYGEDGTVQGLLELANLPYVGSGVLASAVGMDKVLMKTVFAQHGLPQVVFDYFLRREWEHRRSDLLDRLEARFEYPVFVKPANSGSSVGISKARSRAELAEAIDAAIQYDRKVIVEQGIDAREIECSVLGNDDPVASLPGEIRPERDFYDYVAKYSEGWTTIIIPADLPPAAVREVQEIAVSAFQAIDAAGMARVDCFLDKATGRVFLNEINTIPGFTRTSVYPKLWDASGLSYRDLVDRLIQLALERHADKQRSRTSLDDPGA